MKKLVLGLSAAVLLGAGIARAEVMAQDIPPDFIAQFAPLAVPLIEKQFPNPPVKVTADSSKISGWHVMEKMGFVVMPDKALTTKAVEDAGDKETPVAMFATLSLAVQKGEAALPASDQAVAEVQGTFKIPVYFVSVKKKGDERELEIYSKPEKAVLSVPLKKAAAPAGDAAIVAKASNIDLEKKKMDVTVNVGGYEGTFKLAVTDPS